jgi:hypothetical protein
MDRLQPAGQLNAGEQLLSKNAWVKVVMQGDGNVVRYRVQTRQRLWASNTAVSR